MTMNLSEKRMQQISKFLSLVLRHDPGQIDLVLDRNGWADLQELLQKLVPLFPEITMSDIVKIVQIDPKKRYSIMGDKIRANQGHSIDLAPENFVQKTPPEILYHGTTTFAWGLIQKTGAILRMQRHHVHLSEDVQTAVQVASRRKGHLPAILEVEAGRMVEAGFKFYLAENGVWLTDRVEIEFIKKNEDL